MAAAVAADKKDERGDKIGRTITLGPWGDDLKTQDRIKPTLELLDHIRESTGNAMPTESVIALKKYGDGSVIRFVKRADAVQFRTAVWSEDRFNLHAAKLHCSAMLSPSRKEMRYFTKELSEKVKTLILECSPLVRGLDIDDDRRSGEIYGNRKCLFRLHQMKQGERPKLQLMTHPATLELRAKGIVDLFKAIEFTGGQ